MMCFSKLKVWAEDEAGNVTIDWTVLVAMIVGMTFGVMLSIGGGVNEFGDKAETELSDRDPGF